MSAKVRRLSIRYMYIEAVFYFSKPLRLRDYFSKLVKLLFVCTICCLCVLLMCLLVSFFL